MQERRHMTTYRIVDREQNGIPFFDQERNWFIFGDTSASAPGEQRHYEVRAAPRFGIFKETYVTSVTDSFPISCLFAIVKPTELPLLLPPFEYQTHFTLVPFDAKLF